jgi:patatin-like phospholipase/acyl hydrolase
MKINNTTFKTKKFTKSVWLFLFCILFTSFSAQDSLKKNYDLNDPRNPQCPCHKYQKQADDEFKKLLASGNKNSHNTDLRFIQEKSKTNLNSADFSVSNFSLNEVTNKKKPFLLFNKKHKKRIKLPPKIRRFLDVKHWKIFKSSNKLNSCFHWK